MNRKRARRVVAVGLAAGAVIFAALGVVDMWGTPVPEPVVLPTERESSSAHTTAQVYQEWQARNEFVDCVNTQGSTYEPRIVDHRDSLPAAAQYLDVEPATEYPDAPLPALRQPELYADLDSETDGEVGAGTDCESPSTELAPLPPAAINEMVAAARADEDFLTTLAEQVWAQRHPAEVTRLLALGGNMAQPPSEPSDEWTEQHGLVYGAVQDQIVWVPVVAGEYEDFAQSVGLVDSGGAVVIRTGEEHAMLDASDHLSEGGVIRCAHISMSAGVKEPWGSAEDLAEVMRAMGSSCNALIVAGMVEAETLQDVYW